MTKKLCKAGHGGMKDFADLTLQDGVLVHQVAALAAEELDGDVEVRPGGFAQPEAVGGGPPDGGEVGVVGLVVGIGGLAILLGRERMDEAGVEAGLTKRQLDGAMIVAGAFDGDDDILEVVLAHGLTDAVDDGLEVAARVRHGGGFEEGAAVEVGEEVARACLGTVEGDDAEVFGSDLSDAVEELSVGFLQDEALGLVWATCCGRTRHGKLLSRRGTRHPQPERQGGARQEFFSNSNPHTTAMTEPARLPRVRNRRHQTGKFSDRPGAQAGRVRLVGRTKASLRRPCADVNGAETEGKPPPRTLPHQAHGRMERSSPPPRAFGRGSLAGLGRQLLIGPSVCRRGRCHRRGRPKRGMIQAGSPLTAFHYRLKL